MTEQTARPMFGRSFLFFFRDLAIIIVAALLISFVVKNYVIRSFYIPSESMESTLQVNDRIIVEQLTGTLFPLERGDVIVFKDPGGWLNPALTEQSKKQANWFTDMIGITSPDDGEHLIKRIIGLPGDTVECCNGFGQVSVNGQPINELGYVKLPEGITKVSDKEFDVTVPDGMLWVLGDNRFDSADSRWNQHKPGAGFVPVENVVGKAWLISWPLDRLQVVDDHRGVFAGVKRAADASRIQ